MSSGFIKDSNGIRTPFEIYDIELVSSSSVNASASASSSTMAYTSLKDLLPATPSQPSVMSPTNNSSWDEIPIKNPLVKHAAWAYLQPMSTTQESEDDRDLLKMFRRRCCPAAGPRGEEGGRFGCLEYYKEVVWENMKRCFSLAVRRKEEEDEYYYGGGDGEDEYYDDDEEEEEEYDDGAKVD